MRGGNTVSTTRSHILKQSCSSKFCFRMCEPLVDTELFNQTEITYLVKKLIISSPKNVLVHKILRKGGCFANFMRNKT